MNSQFTWKESLLPFCLAASGFFLPVWIRGTTLFLIIGIVVLMLQRKQVQNPFRPEIRWFSSISVAIFIWQFFGMLYTDDLENGWFNLVQKVPILIFPVFMGSCPPISAFWKRNIRIAFVVGCILSGTYLFVKAVQAYLIGHDPIVFTYVRFSPDLHPSYLALYMSVALYFSAEAILSAKQTSTLLVWSVALLVCYGFIVLFQSKAGLICGSLVVVYGCVQFIRKSRKWLPAILLFSGLILLNAGLNYFEKDRIDSRINQAVVSLKQHTSSTENKDSSQQRVDVWKACWKVIQQQPLLGTGAGDVQSALLAEYTRSGMAAAAEKRLNAHNQYLQQLIAGGVLAALLLVFWIFLSASAEKRPFHLASWVIPGLIGINLLTESMLESQWGILAIAFFLSMNRLDFSPSLIPKDVSDSDSPFGKEAKFTH